MTSELPSAEKICSIPGCKKPVTSRCSSCKTAHYCGGDCQKADWPEHKKICEGRLRLQGMACLSKAEEKYTANQWPQALRHAELALQKLSQLKDYPRDEISDAMSYKCYCLGFAGERQKALACAKEWYGLWITKHTHPSAIGAAEGLIECLLQVKEYVDAERFARITWETINDTKDNQIPESARLIFLGRGARDLARTIRALSQNGGIAPEDKQKAGEEAIVLSRMALELETQMYGTEDIDVANGMDSLAHVLDHFNGCDDEEIISLSEQAIAITRRVQGDLSPNVAAGENNLAVNYLRRAKKAQRDNDHDGLVTNLKLALPRYREAARIFRAINHIDTANRCAHDADAMEQLVRQLTAGGITVDLSLLL